MSKKTQEEKTQQFIQKAQKTHGDKYDYSLVKYEKALKKIKIVCKKCGNIFEQKPHSHLNGSGCPYCAGNIKKTTEQFIKEAREIHGNKYDYSLVNYKNATTKIKIICPTHGIFEQKPVNHLNKQGCPFCCGNIKKTTEQFIKEAREIHNNKYDYSLVNYKNNETPVKIICPTHGIFEQTPHNHLKYGCKYCAVIYKAKKISLTQKEFIKKSNKIHNNKYDYSLVNYKNNKTPVKIICPTHGIFEQTPKAHLLKRGCPHCSESKGEKEIVRYLIERNISFERQKNFLECRYKLPLYFDFYIPSLNTCIEYDGLQHFKPIKRFGGNKKFILSQKRDKIKTDYCLKNHIRLIRIRYWETVKEILDLYNLK